MKRLFIGGDQNGCWHDIRIPRVRFPVKKEATLSVFTNSGYMREEIEIEEYELRFLRGRTAEFCVYVLSTIDPDQAMDLLLSNYRPCQSVSGAES